MDSVSKSVTVLMPPIADFTFSPTQGAAPLTVSFTNLTTGGLSYSWQFGDDSVSYEENPVHTYLNAGLVHPQLIASNLPGCSDTAVKTLFVDSIFPGIAVVTLGQLIILGPSPNPANSYVTLGVILPARGRLKISNHDVLGKKQNTVTDAELDKGYHQYNFDVRRLSAGVYLLKIEYGGEIKVIKYAIKGS